LAGLTSEAHRVINLAGLGGQAAAGTRNDMARSKDSQMNAGSDAARRRYITMITELNDFGVNAQDARQAKLATPI
jgi:hypothetical protein